MKTWEEKFDDDIRKKVAGSAVQPPPRLFDQIIPEEKKKRGFLWIWITGIIILVSTALTVHFNTGQMHLIKSINKNNTSESRTFESHDKNSDFTSTKKNTKPADADLISENPQSTLKSNVGEPVDLISSNTETEKIDNSESIDLTISKKKKKKNSKGNDSYYNPVRKSDGNNFAGAFGKLPASGYSNYDPVLSMQTLGHSPSGMKPIQGVQLMNPTGASFDDHLPSKWLVEIYGGVHFRKIAMESNTSDTSLIRLLDVRNAEKNSVTGSHLGANLLYRLTDNFVIGFGMQYNQWQEEFNFDFTEYYTLLDIDTISYFILFPFTPPLMMSNIDSSLNDYQATHVINHKMRFSSIALQSEIRYNFPLNKFVISPGLGLKLNIVNFYKGTTNFNAEFEDSDNTDYYNNSAQVAFTGGLHLGWTVTEKLLLFANPSYTYSPGNILKDDYFYSQKNNSINVGFGVQYNFSKRQAAD